MNKLVLGDCRELLKKLPANLIDSCVTDPPFGHLKSFPKIQWESEIAFDPDTWKGILRVMRPGAHLLSFAHPKTYHRIACAIEDAGFEIRGQILWVFGSAPAFGQNSCLKSLHNPIVLARKPLYRGRIRDNFAKWGTGYLQIDSCRTGVNGHAKGRYPADVLLSPEASQELDQMSGEKIACKSPAHEDWEGETVYRPNGTTKQGPIYADRGGASRWFFCSKVRKERLHFAEKPLDLMRWLVQLVTPAGGIVLDPFAGCGSTLVAAQELGFGWIGIEQEPESYEKARARMRKGAHCR